MRPLPAIGAIGRAVCMLLASGAEAAVIQGRVIDSAGRPAAGTEIRVWRKTIPMQGAVRRNEPVSFDGGESLRADSAGRFATSDMFDGKTPVRVVAQAEGMLAGRSGWVLPEQDVTEVGDIVLAHLRAIVGRVVDSQGSAVAGATVFNVDGHRRVEARTGSTGKFFLDDVPESALYLFAEKEGYRFTGVLLGADKSIELRLADRDDPIAPLRTRDPILSNAERVALARRLLDPYLESVSRQGKDTDKRRVLEELASIDPQAALEWLDRIGIAAPLNKQQCRTMVMLNWMKSRHARNWDDIRAVIEASPEKDLATNWLFQGATYFIPSAEHKRAREWLDVGLVRARASETPDRRVVSLVAAAEGFWRLGDRERAEAVAREAETAANQLPATPPLSAFVVARVARVLAPIDMTAALGWLDRIPVNYQFSQEGAFVALLLAPLDSAKAEEVWNHVGDRVANNPTIIEGRDRNAPDFCFRLARTDPARAQRIASALHDPFWRLRARAAVACAIEGAQAKAQIEQAVSDAELPHVGSDAGPFRTPDTAASALASVLPVAEKIDAVGAREVLWRALSLRPTRPTVDWLDDELLLADVALAQMSARFEPGIARKLLEPAVRQLPSLDTSADRSLQKVMRVVVAAAFVDPDWAMELLDGLSEPPDVSCRQPKHEARLFLARVLGLVEDEYWRYAGFWLPEEE